jgi:hypothetical protein
MMVNELNLTFRKLILFSVLIVLMGVSLVYALSYEFKSQNSSQTLPTTQGVYDGLQLTIALEKAEYSLGEPIDITLTITNISNQTIRFGLDQHNDCDFRVYNDTNNILYKWSNRWIGMFEYAHVFLVTLNAGENQSENLAWPQTCYNTGLSEGVPVLPGTYYIVGQIGPIYYGTNSTIETTPMQVTIVEP